MRRCLMMNKPIDILHGMESKVLKFFNKMQRDTMIISAHDEAYVCSRGTGKSEGIDARRLLQNIWSMPGSTGGLLSPTYAKAWGNTLPAICNALTTWGYYEGIHYFVGRKAPKNMCFKLPKRRPLQDAWSNCVHFWNGTILIVLSFNNGMSANSMSLDWILGPEAKFLDYNKIKEEVIPALRGNPEFDYSPWHHGSLFTTDMPVHSKGYWVLDTEQQMDKQHILYIRELYALYIETKNQLNLAFNQADNHIIVKLKKQLKLINEDLSLARKYCLEVDPVKIAMGKTKRYTVNYAEYDIFDNLEIVGEDYVFEQKRNLPPLLFQTSCLNQRIHKIKNGFYSALDDNIHFYVPEDDVNTADNFRGNSRKLTNASCITDCDLDMSNALHIAFDSNAAINSMVVAQVHKKLNLCKVINSLFVKTPNKLPELVNKFCDYYETYALKKVVIYYDHTFVWTDGKSNDTLIDIIVSTLQKRRWNCTAVYVGQAPSHKWKHEQIDITLKGLNPDYLFLMFNIMNNEYLKIALESTGIRVGRNGFEKDKSAEALEDSPEQPDELKTHITDAVDTLWYGTNFYYADPDGYAGGVYFI